MTSAYREGRLQLLEKLSCKAENSSFVTKFDAWLKKNSRGGLLRPTDSFYLLVRELEIVIRKIPDYSHSHISCKVKESMMEPFMVNHGEPLFETTIRWKFRERPVTTFRGHYMCIFDCSRICHCTSSSQQTKWKDQQTEWQSSPGTEVKEQQLNPIYSACWLCCWNVSH